MSKLNLGKNVQIREGEDGQLILEDRETGEPATVESLHTDEQHTAGSFHTVPPTGDAADIQRVIDNASPGDTVYVPHPEGADRYTGQITVNKSLYLKGAGVEAVPDSSLGPFVVSDLKGSVIDSTGLSGPSVKLDNPDGPIHGFAVEDIGCKTDHQGFQTRKGVVDDDARLFFGKFTNTFVHGGSIGEYAYDISNFFRLHMDRCSAHRCGGGFRGQNEDNTWKFGHIHLTEPFAEISMGDGTNAAYKFNAPAGTLNNVTIEASHANNEGEGTLTDWIGYEFGNVGSAEGYGMRVEKATTAVKTRSSQVDLQFQFLGDDQEVDDTRETNTYKSVSQSQIPILKNEARLTAPNGGWDWSATLNAFWADDFEDNAAFGTRTDRFRGQGEISGGGVGDVVYRPRWTVIDGSPTNSNGVLTLPNDGTSHRARTDEGNIRYGTWRITLNHNTSPSTSWFIISFIWPGSNNHYRIRNDIDANALKLQEVDGGNSSDIWSGGSAITATSSTELGDQP